MTVEKEGDKLAAVWTAIFSRKTLMHQKPAAATREGEVFRYLADHRDFSTANSKSRKAWRTSPST